MRIYARLERHVIKKINNNQPAGTKVCLPFSFLQFAFWSSHLLLFLFSFSSNRTKDDSPSIPRWTRLGADVAHSGRGPQQMRPAAAGAKGVLPFVCLQCFHVPPTNFSSSSFTQLRRRGGSGGKCAGRRVGIGDDAAGRAGDYRAARDSGAGSDRR